MMVAILVPVYLAALILGSLVLHLRYRCVAAACLAGFIASFLATSVVVAFEEKSVSLSDYVGAFWWGGISLWIVSSSISGFIGLPFQRKKAEMKKPNQSPKPTPGAVLKRSP